MSEELKRNLRRRETWIRLLNVLLFVLVYTVAEIVLTAVVVFQFGFLLITGERDGRLLGFGARLSHFMFDLLRYFSFNTDERPFPFADWPPPERNSGSAAAATQARPQSPRSAGTRTRKKRTTRKPAAAGPQPETDTPKNA